MDTATTAKTHDVGESDFFISSLKFATHRLPKRSTVNGKLAKKKKEQEEMDQNSRLSGVLGPSVGTTVER